MFQTNGQTDGIGLAKGGTVHGCLQGYKVYYTLTPSLHASLWTVHEVTDNNLLTTVSNLLENRTYSLRVLAFTRIGDGPLSHIVNVTTSTGTPAYVSRILARYF